LSLFFPAGNVFSPAVLSYLRDVPFNGFLPPYLVCGPDFPGQFGPCMSSSNHLVRKINDKKGKAKDQYMDNSISFLHLEYGEP
jgi:hypothetical protein